MSRSVRDLRDLICVSRLQGRISDDEGVLSDDEGRVSRAFAAVLSFGDVGAGKGRESSQSSPDSLQGSMCMQKSSDSGFATNGQSPESDIVEGGTPTPPTEPPCITPTPPSDSKPDDQRRRRKKKRKGVSVSIGHSLPLSAPLPPVGSSPAADPSHGSSSPLRLHDGKNFDDILVYIDASLIAEWLAQANQQVSELSAWCHTADNAAHFMHFWLSEIPDAQRAQLIRMERDIICDHLMLAFRVGREQGHVTTEQVDAFGCAVFREYPRRLSRSRGAFVFLDTLDVLISERTEAYKLLLTDVTCGTRIQQHAQWTLAMRAFALASVWHGVLTFYRNVHAGVPCKEPDPKAAALASMQDTRPQRMMQAIRLGYVEVVHYLLVTEKVPSSYTDAHGRTLIFSAVVEAQFQVLQYLGRQADPRPDVNKPADNGNTPLHAAANNGDVRLVTALLQCPGINVNPANSLCDGATPLHLAIMYGHEHVAEVLLCAGADKKSKMADITAQEQAKAIGHREILHMMQKY